MNPKLEETVVLDFTTHNPSTGAAADADSTPTVEVFEDANDTPILTPTPTKRTAKTGNYRVSVACTAANGFEAGKSYNVVVSATVGGVTGKAPIQRLLMRTRGVDDVLPTSGYTAPPTAAAIRSEIDANSTKLDTNVGSRLATAGYTAPDNAGITGIKAKTDQLGFTGAAVDAVVTEPVTVSDLEGFALQQIAAKMLLYPSPTLNMPTVGARTIVIPDINAANDGAFVGATVVHMNAAGELIQLRTITEYDHTTKTITVDQDWLVAPADTDRFNIYEIGNAVPLSVMNQTVEGLVTLKKSLRGITAALLGRSSGHTSGASSPKYRDLANAKDRISATTDADGNRTTVTLDLDD